MYQVISSGQALLSVSATTYLLLMGGYQDALDFDYRQLIAAPGKLSHLRVELDGTPGVGKSYTFTLRVNGVNTALVVTISDAETRDFDIVNEVAVAAGDYVNISCVPAGTPSSLNAQWTIRFSGTNSQESLIMGNSYNALNPYATEYNSCARCRTDWSNVEDNHRQVIPTDGHIKNLYVMLKSHGDGAGEGYKFTLRLNGADTLLTCTLLQAATTGNDVAHSIDVTGGDIVTLQCEPINAPGGIPPGTQHWGFCFEADTDGESVMLNCAPYDLDTSSTLYNSPDAIRYSWNASRLVRDQLGQLDATIMKLFIKLSAAPGAPASGKSYTFTLMKNGVAQTLTVTILEAATTGSDVVHSFTVADDDNICLRCVPANTPALAQAYWGMVGYLPAPLPPTGIADKSAHMGSKLIAGNLI